ncbi:MAG: DUF1643 domain-containing protein [Hyphomicrobiales bacterium]|nr:DUF1643 domain-containing protein [Hyphomicrobiales bacterium]
MPGESRTVRWCTDEPVIHGSAEFGETRGWPLRFRLDRWWDERPRALVCMANPSHAGAERDDPTISNLVRLARPLPIGGFTVVNAEPFIASVPAVLYRWRRHAIERRLNDYRAIRRRNLALIRELSESASLRIVAWGRLLSSLPPAPLLLSALSLDFTRALHAFALTKDGCPKHPLARGRHRIEASPELVLWRRAATEEK